MIETRSCRYSARHINGILLLNKPKSFSSNQALQKVKHLFQAKKAGHTGSLDPLATGMLPICFGEATKFSHFLLSADKTYRVVARLGAATNTGDAEGEVIQHKNVPKLSIEDVLTIIQQFIGTIEQIPPMYSALKYQGQPLYKLARQGITIERSLRLVTIYHINLLDLDIIEDRITFEVRCSKGTYVRTLVEDIAKALNTIGYVESLHRLWVSPFVEQKQYDLDYLSDISVMAEKDQLLLSVDFAVQHLPLFMLNDVEVKKIQNGQALELSQFSNETQVRLYSEDQVFIGVGEIRENRLYAKRLLSDT